MTQFVVSTHPFQPASLSARLGRALVSLARALAHRLQVQQLLLMDERALKDIGLLRSDVVGALAGPLDRDPSTLLVVKSVERRARIRAAQNRGRFTE